MLTATVNPDFGQVEADPAVVNLGAFETFFSERRPFFVEGSGNFEFGLDCSDGACTGLFYSRRIGRTPHRSADAPEGGYADQPAQYDDSRRRQAHRPDRQVLDRRAQRHHQPRERPRSRQAPG